MSELVIPISTLLEINGIPVEYEDEVTMRGLETIASCLAAPFSMIEDSWMSYIAIGSGEDAPSSDDEYLIVESYRKKGSISTDGNRYILQATFGSGEPSGSTIIREIGLLNAIKGGTLGARWLLADDVVKGAEAEVTVICTIVVQE